MPRIRRFELFALDLPFRQAFKHSAAARTSSDSLLLKCTLDDESVGFGESLPREYVTGETRDSAFDFLAEKVLPRLSGNSFDGLAGARAFLEEHDGKAPREWGSCPGIGTAAWCAVDMALLDAFARSEGTPLGTGPFPDQVRFSPVISAGSGFSMLKTLLKIRLNAMRQVKLKVGTGDDVAATRLASRILGSRSDVRVDANMAWTLPQARETMPALARVGVTSFEQPLPAADLDGLAALVKDTGLSVMLDESLSDAESLRSALDRRACTAVNVRISKCGGFVASLTRCLDARRAGLDVQVGCQVGESSLLSAAQLCLLRRFPHVRYLEGCFGLYLLREDLVRPSLRFRYGGRPPALPAGAGWGVVVDEDLVRSYATRSLLVGGLE